MNILLTRPLMQINKLKNLVLQAGHNPVIFPTLQIQSLSVILKKNKYDAVFFISANAVEFGIDLLRNITYEKVFAVGASTAQKLQSFGIHSTDFPKEKASSEALLSLDSVKKMHHAQVLIFRGKGGMETLKNGLILQNNTIEYAQVYERVVCEILPIHQQNLQYFLANKQGVVSITSIENLDFLLQLAKEDSVLLKTYPLIVLSERIKKYALKQNFKDIFTCEQMSDASIIKTLLTIDTFDMRPD
jgi:uroporphyrinogen-III synthase